MRERGNLQGWKRHDSGSEQQNRKDAFDEGDLEHASESVSEVRRYRIYGLMICRKPRVRTRSTTRIGDLEYSLRQRTA